MNGRDHLEDVDMIKMIILKEIFNKYSVKMTLHNEELYNLHII
jgi:hypothetical protein